jgi:hypothetical protein
VQKLESRGIALDKIVAAANGKGKIVPADDGPDGPGIYFVGGKKPLILEPPADPTCGFICSIGLAATKVLGCNSEASCVVAAATVFMPGGGACRVGRAALRATKAGRGSGARAAARANLRDLGLEGLNLAGRSYNSGRKALEARGFEIVRTTSTGRKYFRHPKTGHMVIYDPARRGGKPHWHIQDKGGQRYDRSGRPAGRDEGKTHIPGS